MRCMECVHKHQYKRKKSRGGTCRDYGERLRKKSQRIQDERRKLRKRQAAVQSADVEE